MKASVLHNIKTIRGYAKHKLKSSNREQLTNEIACEKFLNVVASEREKYQPEHCLSLHKLLKNILTFAHQTIAKAEENSKELSITI